MINSLIPDQYISFDIGCDGPSLPILSLYLKFKDKTQGVVMLSKDQVEELIKELQNKLKEM